MRNLFLIAVISIMLISCQNDVGRYQLHVLNPDDKYSYRCIVIDTKEGSLLYLDEEWYDDANGDRVYYGFSKKYNYATGEISYSMGSYDPLAEPAFQPARNDLAKRKFGDQASALKEKLNE